MIAMLPDAGMVQIADSPEVSNTHLKNCLTGIMIETVGLSFYLGHKTLLMARINKSQQKLITTPLAKNLEQKKLAEWATNFKNYVSLKPRDKFNYLAQTTTTNPHGNLAKKLTKSASNSWDFVGRMEHEAGFITTSELYKLTAETRSQSFDSLLGNTPIIIKNKQEFLALPQFSRIGFIGRNGELKHAMSKLDDGIAIGFKNDYLRIDDENTIQAFDLSTAISWGADGSASINGGPTFTVQAYPASGILYDEKYPSRLPKTRTKITPFSASSMNKLVIKLRHKNPDENSVSVAPDSPPPVKEVRVTADLNHNQSPDSDDFDGLSVLITQAMPVIDCTTLCAKQKIDTALTTFLSRTNSISYQAAAALLRQYDNTVKTALTKLSLNAPEAQWDNLSAQIQKLFELKYLLIDQGNDLTVDKALKLASTYYSRALAPTTFDRIYFDQQEPLMLVLEQDTTLIQEIRTNPSAAVTKYLLLDSPEKITTFLNSLREFSTADTEWRSIVENTALHADMLAYSSEMIAIFLKRFQLDTLPLPRSFDRLAWLYAYIECKDSGQPWVFDAHRRTVQKVRINLSRQLGLQQSMPRLVTAVLKAFGYRPDRMGLSGSDGRSLYDLRRMPELNNIPGYTSLTDQQQFLLFDALQARTSLATDYRLGSLAASVYKTAELFTDTNLLAAMRYPDGEDALFSQLIALDLIAYNNVRKVNAQWAQELWQTILDRRATVPGLGALIDHLIEQYPTTAIDRIISAAHRLSVIAKASPSATTPAELIDFALQRIRYQLRPPLIGGDSPATLADSISHFLQEKMANIDGQPHPVSIADWKQWLKTQPTFPHPLHTRWIEPPNQQTINNTLANAIQTIRWKKGLEKLAALQTDADKDPSQLWSTDPLEQYLAGADLLVRSGFDDITTTIDGLPYDVKLLGIEGLVTTVYQDRDAWYDGNFRSNQSPYAQMLARDTLTGSFYSSKFYTGQRAATLEVAGSLLSNTPSLALLTKIRDDLTDFSDNNGTKTFDDIFIFKQTDLEATRHNPRTIFNDIYAVPLFRAIINVVKPYIGKWTLIYGQPAHIDPIRHFVYIPWDSQWQYLPRDFDLTGTPQAISAPRLYLEQWLAIFLQQRSVLKKSSDQDLTVLLTNIILDQAGLLTYERISSDQPRTPLPVPDRLYQFDKMRWKNRYANDLLTSITSGQYKGPHFSYNATESKAVTLTLAQLASLPPEAFYLPALSAISVEAGDNSQQYLDNFLKIYRQIYDRQGIGARLMTKYRSRIGPNSRWHFIYVDPEKTHNIFTSYSASHRIDHETETVYLVDPTLHSFFYLTANGLKQVGATRQATQILLQILLHEPDLDGRLACTKRNGAGPLTDIVIRELNHNSPTAIAAATVVASQENHILQLLKNSLSVARYATYENQILSNALSRYYGISP
ncbi:hypothetical protein ACVBEF_06090 [Glaciimonas sp. GG7]